MEDLVKWLRAQLDEDERIAKAATARQPYDEWIAVGAGDENDTALKFWSVVKIARMEQTPAARDLAVFIAEHDPARVLQEIDAKRRILDDVLPSMQADEQQIAGEWGVGSDPVREASDDLLSLLALPYVDRPGYQESWRP